MIFVDASHYLSLLIKDPNYVAALEKSQEIVKTESVTSQAILGEVLTVGSMRFNRQGAITYVNQILDSGTIVIFETEELVASALKIFTQVKSKNVGWVDCYTLAIMKQLQISTLASFDKELQSLVKRYT